MTNREFAAASPVFIRACELAEIPATKRQASKWQRKQGTAYAFRNQAVTEVVERKSTGF